MAFNANHAPFLFLLRNDLRIRSHQEDTDEEKPQ
jgi:hypothetical protein